MITPELLDELYRHMEWADSVVWNHVPEHDGVPDDELRELLVHIHSTQEAFLAVWGGEPFTIRRGKEFDTLSAVRDYARPFYAAAAEVREQLTPDALNEPMPVPWVKYFERVIGRKAEVTTRGETMMQVAMHTQYHRAQVNARLRILGVEPPLVDYIAWVWRGRPGPSDDS